MRLRYADDEYADFYQVRYGDVGSGARALVIETDADLAVKPCHSGCVIIRRA